jgi:hypothetical protein
MTTLSQNALRMRKPMTLPLLPHGVVRAAVEGTLAKALEGEVRCMPLFLSIFESSSRQIFLKFER